MKRLALALVLASCGDDGGSPVRPDARPIPDGDITDGATVDEAMGGFYRHTITLDGTDDFTAGERFDTTSASFQASVTWDDVNLYVGYSGPDLSTTVTDASTKWLFVYLDTQPGGATQSEQYNTQRATFPSGFAADYYVRYRADGTLTSVKSYDGNAWVDAGTASAAQAGTFVELAVLRSAIGATQQMALVTWMINEKALAEGSYAGLYSDNFTDGYAMDLALTRSLAIDFMSANEPNASR